jgi:hypothetical protein
MDIIIIAHAVCGSVVAPSSGSSIDDGTSACGMPSSCCRSGVTAGVVAAGWRWMRCREGVEGRRGCSCC